MILKTQSQIIQIYKFQLAKIETIKSFNAKRPLIPLTSPLVWNILDKTYKKTVTPWS